MYNIRMKYRIAIDIGTTNIEYALCDEAHNIIHTQIQTNVNQKYGLDVMTRITKANEGNLSSMTSDLRASLTEICSSYISDYDIKDIVIAGNTTMIHILMGYDCSTLGVYPFVPYNKNSISCNASDIGITHIVDSANIGLHNINIPVYIFPCISAFIGGDIVSGLTCIPHSQGTLFIDMGTNAEMVLYSHNATYCLSAAAGPAFETHSRGKASDVVSALSDMLDKGIIDDTGLLSDEYFEKGITVADIHFSQKKIRDLQCAKSAIRTGIELLIKESGLSVGDITNVYIAGNLGINLDAPKAAHIGLIPCALVSKITLSGNTSLIGACRYFDTNTSDLSMTHIELASLPDFNDLYIQNINF